MTAFEYDIYTVTWGHDDEISTIKDDLNARGSEGWELVGMTRDESPTDEHDDEVIMFVFKRPKG